MSRTGGEQRLSSRPTVRLLRGWLVIRATLTAQPLCCHMLARRAANKRASAKAQDDVHPKADIDKSFEVLRTDKGRHGLSGCHTVIVG